MVKFVYTIYKAENKKDNLYVTVDYEVDENSFGDIVNEILDSSKFLINNFSPIEREQIEEWHLAHNAGFDVQREKYIKLKEKIDTMREKGVPTEKTDPLDAKLEKMKEVLRPIGEQIQAVSKYLNHKGKRYPRRELINLNFPVCKGLKKLKDGSYFVMWDSS